MSVTFSVLLLKAFGSFKGMYFLSNFVGLNFYFRGYRPFHMTNRWWADALRREATF